MSDDMREELTRMLDQYDVRRRADTAREGKTKDDDAQFLERFARLRREVARSGYSTRPPCALTGRTGARPTMHALSGGFRACASKARRTSRCSLPTAATSACGRRTTWKARS